MTLTYIFILFLYISPAFAQEPDWDKLVSAVIEVESGGDPHAVSKAGAIGLMQITPIVLCEYNNENRNYVNKIIQDGEVVNYYYYDAESIFTTDDLSVPKYNVKIGTFYLKRLKNHYLKDNYTLERLLCAWNGGITKLRRYNYDCSKMPRESREFSMKVMAIYNER